jgi:hypothetical protein
LEVIIGFPYIFFIPIFPLNLVKLAIYEQSRVNLAKYLQAICQHFSSYQARIKQEPDARKGSIKMETNFSLKKA